MNNPYAVPDADIIAAVEAAIAEGDTDTGGGAHPSAVAARTPLSESGVAPRLRQLADEGELVQVWGVGPHIPRQSFRLPD